MVGTWGISCLSINDAFGYYIPVRGEQVRNLCREKSFIIENGRVEKIIINTDKNVNRKNYQELPCFLGRFTNIFYIFKMA